MNKCITCNHISKDPITYTDNDPDSLTYGDEVITSFRKCNRISFDECYRPTKGEGAVCQDGSGYKARVCVEESFGCVLWEAKFTQPPLVTTSECGATTDDP